VSLAIVVVLVLPRIFIFIIDFTYLLYLFTLVNSELNSGLITRVLSSHQKFPTHHPSAKPTRHTVRGAGETFALPR